MGVERLYTEGKEVTFITPLPICNFRPGRYPFGLTGPASCAGPLNPGRVCDTVVVITPCAFRRIRETVAWPTPMGWKSTGAHHHDKVVVSIPDVEVRDVVVQEFPEAAWLFEDVSGYVFSGDEYQRQAD